MSLYSAIQFTSVSFLYASGSNLGDFQVTAAITLTFGIKLTNHQFLYIDLLLILPIAIFSQFAAPLIVESY